jgi:hypothetical protein
MKRATPAAGSAQAAAPARPAAASPSGKLQPAPSSPSGKQPAAGGKAGKKGFRETAWFKTGELEEELARKAAEMSSDDPLAGPAMTEANVDESTLTAEDRARLSLKTGRTEIMPAIRPGLVPGDRMSEEEMLAEFDTSRRWMVIVAVAIALVSVLGAVYFLFLRAPAPK